MFKNLCLYKFVIEYLLMTQALKQESAPGIGTVGQIERTNFGTRAVLVVPLITSPEDLIQTATHFPNKFQRKIIKAVVPNTLQPNTPLGDGQFTVEASLPFAFQGAPISWVVCGHNSGPRAIDDDTKIASLARLEPFRNGKFETQTADQMISAFREVNPGLDNVTIVRITPENITDLKPTITDLYTEAFDSYPYDVAQVVADSCGKNVYVCALDGHNRALAITGAELITLPSGITIGEVGDSASLTTIKSSGAMMKRALMTELQRTGNIPDLAFTDSRIAAVVGINRRAGLILPEDTLLPRHTAISSTRAPGVTVDVPKPNGEKFQVEDMTMTYADRARIEWVLANYGEITVN